MAANLKRTTSNVGTSRTLALTASAGVQTIIIGGLISNSDPTEAYHGITIEIQKPDNAYVVLVKNSPVSVGGSLMLPKIVLDPGDKVYLTADAASVVQAHISYVEKN